MRGRKREWAERERERERQRDRDRETERQRQTDREAGRQTDRQTDRQRQAGRQTDRQTDIARDTDSPTEAETARQRAKGSNSYFSANRLGPRDFQRFHRRVSKTTVTRPTHASGVLGLWNVSHKGCAFLGVQSLRQ